MCISNYLRINKFLCSNNDEILFITLSLPTLRRLKFCGLFVEVEFFIEFYVDFTWFYVVYFDWGPLTSWMLVKNEELLFMDSEIL